MNIRRDNYFLIKFTYDTRIGSVNLVSDNMSDALELFKVFKEKHYRTSDVTIQSIEQKGYIYIPTCKTITIEV